MGWTGKGIGSSCQQRRGARDASTSAGGVSPPAAGLEGTQLRYDTRFRTFPSPEQPAPLRFAVLGDYGVGLLASGGSGDRQRQLGAALERAVDHAGVRLIVTTGDNIYMGQEDTAAGTGKHDDDWYFSFYEPYRYAISRVPVYPGVGNHDSSDSEASDDRDQLADQLFTDLRFSGNAEVGRASVDPGLYYRFSYGTDIEFVAVDTTTLIHGVPLLLRASPPPGVPGARLSAH